MQNDVAGYMQKMFINLGNDYKGSDGYMYACSLIAFDLAFMMLNESPSLTHFRNVTPIRYNSRINFGGHTVCVCGDKVYDPMVSDCPTPMSKYSILAFGKDINPSRQTDTNYIRQSYYRVILGNRGSVLEYY